METTRAHKIDFLLDVFGEKDMCSLTELHFTLCVTYIFEKEIIQID
ncbi:MAG: hypothetical protein ABI184_08440 [Ginsengibacter sp.]